jgi:hypothetical protein
MTSAPSTAMAEVGRHPLDNRKRRLSLRLDIEPAMRANVGKARVVEVGEPQLGAEPTELGGEIDPAAPAPTIATFVSTITFSKSFEAGFSPAIHDDPVDTRTKSGHERALNATSCR